MKYINNFSSLIPALQGNKALRRVEELRQIGEIQSETEYNDALSSILESLSLDGFSPTFKFTPFQPGISSSEQYNTMLGQIRDDLEVAFTEANNIYATIQAHDLLFKDKVINELYAAINELEKEIDKLLIIADSDNSFDEVFINSFSGDANRIDILDTYARELLYDIPIDAPMAEQDYSFIDPDEALMTLPLVNQKDITFSEIVVVGTQSTGTDYDIQLIDSSIDSIISNGDSFGWVYNVLKQDSLTHGAKLVIDASLGDKRVINFLVVKPVADFPSVLENIQYVNEHNQTLTLPNSELFGQSISGPVKISFDDIVASRIVFTFTQRSSTLFSYNSNATQITLDDLRRDTSIAANAQMLRDQINSQIQNVDMLSVLPVSATPTPEYQVLYQYTFGFTYLAAGLAEYKDKGYFVSKPQSKNSVGLIGLQVQEFDTQYFDEVAQTVAPVGSFEYSMIKKDYNERGELINSAEVPVLPLGKTSITKERIAFSATRTILPLRFLGHSSAGSGAGIILYRNNIPLVRGIDWTFADRLNLGDLSDSSLKPGLPNTRITILHSSDVIRTGIYTVSYTPRHIAEPNNIISYQGVTFLSTNVTEHKISLGSDVVHRSDLFIKIVIRNNSFYGNKTPKLASYKLLASSVSADKYIRL